MRFNPSHRGACGVAAALLVTLSALGSASPSRAETYPSRVVTIVSPYPAGGLGDILPRAMADALSKQTGQNFIVDNKPGATQMVGTRFVANARPDGYTLLFGSVTSLAINPGLKKNLPYDPVGDFEPIALSYMSPMYLVAKPSLPVNSVQELLELARRNPGKLNYSSGGPGSSSHLAAELFKIAGDVDLTHVPYTGTGPAIRDVVAGFIDVTFTASGMSYAASNQVKALGVSSARRALATPQLPTLAESGLPGYEATIWFGFLAPKGTPREIVDKLYAEMKKAAESGAVKERLRAGGDEVEVMAQPPEQFRPFIASQIGHWRKVVETARIPSD